MQATDSSWWDSARGQGSCGVHNNYFSGTRFFFRFIRGDGSWRDGKKKENLCEAARREAAEKQKASSVTHFFFGVTSMLGIQSVFNAIHFHCFCCKLLFWMRNIHRLPATHIAGVTFQLTSKLPWKSKTHKSLHARFLEHFAAKVRLFSTKF